MNSDELAISLNFSPLIGANFLIGLSILAVLLIALSFFNRRPFSMWRIALIASFLLVLSNPSIHEVVREPLKDVAVVISDQSPSQSFGQRDRIRQTTVEDVKNKLSKFDNLDVRYVHSPNEKSALDNQTLLFEALDSQFADVPPSRRAGAILITDGQVHDIPKHEAQLSRFGPVHALLTGKRNERDRQIEILEAPTYGLSGEMIPVTYQIVDSGHTNIGAVPVTVRWGAGQEIRDLAIPGEPFTLELPIENAGQNIFELSVETLPGEMTLTNNKTAIVINGVRDRLKVLLVSGRPHNGGRTWRDMLTADPGVDLVHFTILREPDKLDQTPQRELSLIAFPFRELFEIKLYDFDLIIFDRYSLNRILPTFYFDNIARYVREGGAFLEASGPSFADEFSIYNTSLRQILPGRPSGQVFKENFKPEITPLGQNHPVTMDFVRQQENWGQWLRQIAITATAGDVVLSGLNEQPLMILSRVGEGRVAQIASDQIWLWSRGYDGGGPHRELLRRTVHWLMKEPELDENALSALIKGDDLIIRRRSLKDPSHEVRITKPDGQTMPLTLSRDGPTGWLTARIPVEQTGVYTIEDGRQSHSVLAGAVNAPEQKAVITTDEKLEPLTTASNGSIKWLGSADNLTLPDIRMTPDGRRYSGLNWIGLRTNNDYSVAGFNNKTLVPFWLALGVLSALSVLTWWREGKQK